MAIEYNRNDPALTADEYVMLFSTLWRHPLDSMLVARALVQTINVTARDGGRLVGCARVLTDGYLFATITEIIVHRPYAGRGVGQRLLELAGAASPTSVCFGVQTVSEELMRRMGWTAGPTTYFKRKPLPTPMSD